MTTDLPALSAALWLAFAGGPECQSDGFAFHNTTTVFKSSCQPIVATPPAVTPPAATPRAIPAKVKPITKAKPRPRKRSSACGSKRQVWRTLRGGHRKYRCK